MRFAFLLDEDPLEPQGGSALRDRHNILACSKLGQVFVICTRAGKRATVRYDDCITVKYYGSEHSWLLSDERAARFGRQPQRAYNLIARPIGQKILAHTVGRDLRSFAPQVVIFEEYKCAALASGIGGLPATVIYDAHNVEARLRPELAGDGRALGRVARSIVRREHRLAAIADQIWTCSEVDRIDAMRRLSTGAPVCVVPNVVDPRRYQIVYDANEQPSPDGAPDLVFCGSFNYRPNQQAADLLVRRIFPAIVKELPRARLRLVGRNPTAEMGAAAKRDPRIVVTGSVPDPVEHLRGGCFCLVPLLTGGGTRLKILEAFASGCPVISTRKGAEGLAATDGEHLLLAETPDEFAAATVRLFQDAELRRRIVGQAHDLVIALYSPEALHRQIKAAIDELSPKQAHSTADRAA